MAKSSGGVRGGGGASNPSAKIAEAITSLKDGKRASATPFTIGNVEKRMREYAKQHGIELASDKLSMSARQIQHALRDTKNDANKAVSKEELISFPKRIGSMKLFYDSKKGKFVYTDGHAKYIIHPNYAVKKNGRHVNFITASKITSSQEFSMSNYIKIE